MSKPEAASAQADLEALEALQADAEELERLESLLDRFNVFEAIGFVGQEVMHSRFLAFLLDPAQNHGLDNSFLRGFLQAVLGSTDRALLSHILDREDGGNLNQTTVQTEVYTGDGRIDILLLNETGRWAMIIENKVWSAEHSDQLGRYYRFVKKTHPRWETLGCYLTPFGSLPSRAEDRKRYLPLGYGAVCDLVDGVLEQRGSELGSEVRVAMNHYADMVRRQIVDDSEITRLCRSIYRRHKKALDVIYEKRPNHQAVNRAIVSKLVESAEGLTVTNRSATYVWFQPQRWQVPALDLTEDPAGFLRFAFHANSEGLDLYLETSPGDEWARRKLFELGQTDPSLFNHLEDPDTDRWPKLYHRAFLLPDLRDDALDSEREQEIGKKWGEFLDEDLPRIEKVLRQEAWIWETTEYD